MPDEQLLDYLSRNIRRQFVVVSIAAVVFAATLLAPRFWLHGFVEQLSFSYLILFGFLYLPIFIIYRWHIRRAIRWSENHLEPGARFTDSAEYKLHKLAPYFLLAVCVLTFALFLPLCLGDLRKGTYECRTIPEHISHSIRGH